LAVRTRGATEAVGPNLDPKQCALLVLGCETNVLSAIPNSVALTLKINAAIDIVRRHGGSIGFMRIAFSDLDYQSIPSTNKEFSALAHQRRYRNGTSDADLHPALAVQPDDVVVRATRLGAFSTTDLDEQLTNLGVTTLFICGVDSTGVVLSTVRDAADRDYRLIVLADCTADPDRTAHDLLMSRIIPRQAEVTTVARLYRWFSPAHAGAPDNHSRTRSTAS
jgi:nicotinamidase-related amidase